MLKPIWVRKTEKPIQRKEKKYYRKHVIYILIETRILKPQKLPFG